MFVAAIGSAQIKAAQGVVFIPGADRQCTIFIAVAVFRNGPVRVDLSDVVRVIGQQLWRVVDRFVLTERGEAVEAPLIVEADFGIRRQVVFVTPGTAPARVLHLAIGEILVADIVRFIVQRVKADGQKAVPRQSQAVPAISGFAEAVTLRKLAQLSVDLPAAVALFEHDVDHPGNRIRTVLCRGTVTQHLDVVDGADRDHVQVDRLRTNKWHTARQVHHCRRMSTLAVDQHQRFVRGQPAQRSAFRVLATGCALVLRKVERGQQLEQCLVEGHGAGLHQLFAVDHVHGGAAAQGRGVGAPSADGDHPVQGCGGRSVLGLGPGFVSAGRALFDDKRPVRADLQLQTGAAQGLANGLLRRQRAIDRRR